ncbi:MAG: nitrilase-related carbon-nitrogen hydrolase [Candidatus Acidiferrales bacterium]
MDSKRNPFALAALALIASSAALYLGTGLRPHWWLEWVAPIPVLLLAPRVSRCLAFGVALAAWAAGALNEWQYVTVLKIPLGVVLLIVLVPAVVFAADVLVYRGFLRTSPWRAALIFPSIWVFYEFASESLSPHSTAGNISYSQMNFLPVLQLASVTGIWGISFCVLLFASTVSVLLSADDHREEKRRLAIAVGFVLLVVLGFGTWRLHSTPPTQNTVVVGLLASDLQQNLLATNHDDTLRLMQEYASEAEKLAAQGAKVVVIPEKTAVVLNSDLPEVDALFSSAAEKTGASILIGVIHPTPGAKWNEARLYFPDGTIRTYEKHHMLPSFESSFKVGTEKTEWQEPSGRWGITICKDMDFPGLSRAYGNDGTALLLVPAWDFDVDGWLHGRMAILRGVESGFSIVRAPKQGILTVTDDRGRVLAEEDSKSAPFASLLAAVPVRHDDTIYARFGDWFAWTNIAVMLALIGTALFGRVGNKS